MNRELFTTAPLPSKSLIKSRNGHTIEPVLSEAGILTINSVESFLV